MTKFKVGFIGAGYIADFHLAAIRRLPQIELVGVFDVDSEKAGRFAAKARSKVYQSMNALQDAGATVLHVLTPPDTHCEITLKALALGCHAFVEKPLAVDVAQCEEIRQAVQRTGLQVCVSHSLQFDPQVRRALAAVRAGKLGRVVSVDILRSSDYPPYAGGPLPPQYRSAGYPFRDLGVHALYLLQSFLGPIEDVAADWLSLGGEPNLAFDEWRALVKCREGLGQFQLSWNAKPLQSQIIIQGTKGVLRVDLFLMSQTKRSSLPVPKAAERVVNALSDSIPMAFDVPRNVFRFLTKRALPYHGLQDLIREFYFALEKKIAVPVPVEEATTVVKWTERVAREADRAHEEKISAFMTLHGPKASLAGSEMVVITGAAGTLGSAVARSLQVEGTPTRLFVRRPLATVATGVQVALGNLGDPRAVDEAIKGASTVVHIGAAMKGSWPNHQCATITGTKNVLDACKKYGVQKLVYISSMSVIDWARGTKDSFLDETSPLETRAMERGNYTQAKLAAEVLVSNFVREQGLPAIILRPGKIFGEGAPLLSPAIGWNFKGRWLVLGGGDVRLPLVHLDDAVDAVLSAIRSSARSGEIVQVTDSVQLTQNEIIRLCEGPDAKTLHIPRFLVFSLGFVSQLLLKPVRRTSPLSVYRLKSALARRRFQSYNAGPILNWCPKIGVIKGIEREVMGKASEDPTSGTPERIHASEAQLSTR